MEDEKIVELFWSREENAIAETERKYGRYCMTIAQNILASPEDAAECVNDTYLNAWNAIPPQRPKQLRLFLGKIARNLAINRYHYAHAQKRGGDTEEIFNEFWDCIPGKTPPPEESLALKEALNGFLADMLARDRIVFLRRYWYFCSVREIAEGMGLSQSNVKRILFQARNRLKNHLEKEGILL